VREIFELRTRAGLRIRATSNHPFRMLDRWAPLSELKAGDRIAVAREIPVFGRTPLPDWEATLLGLMISEGQCNTPGHSPTYTTADPAMVKLLERTVAESGMGETTFKGRYGYRLVNRKGRGGIPEKNRAHLWLKAHGLNVGAADKFVPQCVFMAPEISVRLFLQALFGGDGSVYHSDTGFFIEYYSNSHRLIEDVHHLLLRFGVFSLIRNKITAVGTRAWRLTITDKQQIQRFAERIGFTPDSLKQRVLDEEVLPMILLQPRRRSNFDTLPQEAWGMLYAAARVGGTSFAALNIKADVSQSVPLAAARRVALATGDLHVSPLAHGPIWDVVDGIEPAGEEEVFDISVPGPHNFVANDMIVHNSTYARCFHGATRVALIDGSSAALEDMARRHATGELFWGYSVGPNGRVIVSLLDAPRCVGRDALLEVTLDNGQKIQATPDHLFIRRDGRMTPAGELRPGDSLMPLYRDLRRGHEYVYQPLNGRLLATNRLADEWNLRHGIYEPAPTDRSVFRYFPEVISSFPGTPGRNHKVAAIRELPGVHDVYCLTVPEAGNFALEAGVFVKNCGIIVNVTPLEPEWEGHVTLEFSNTTPLPAKIYANEGVAQVLFFESDEVCATSYADRAGKYQGQRGVTLPKA
jgi:intein/homing endonuclease